MGNVVSPYLENPKNIPLRQFEMHQVVHITT